jgi:hypothetical protein
MPPPVGYISKQYDSTRWTPHIQSLMSPSVTYRPDDCSGVYPFEAAICSPMDLNRSYSAWVMPSVTVSWVCPNGHSTSSENVWKSMCPLICCTSPTTRESTNACSAATSGADAADGPR